MTRVKDIVESHAINEAQVRDASQPFQALMDAAPSASSAIGSAYGEISGITATAKAALHAIQSAISTKGSTGVEQNVIVDNINDAQQAQGNPNAIITLSDHIAGVQQAYNVLMSIQSSLNTAMGLCNKLNQLASRQFL